MFNLNETEFKIHLHHKLCEVSDILLAYYNPCNISDGGKCKAGNIFCCHNTYYESKDGGCIFLSNTGCTVNSLGCKVWFCNEVFDNLPRKLKLSLKAIEIVDRLFMLSSYPPEHLVNDYTEYQIKDTLAYFNEE